MEKKRLGDKFGHKIFLIGTAWYGVWSLVAGFSVYRKGVQGSILFSVGRGFQGIGPSLMVPNALAIAGRSFQGEKKNLVLALFGASAPGWPYITVISGRADSKQVVQYLEVSSVLSSDNCRSGRGHSG